MKNSDIINKVVDNLISLMEQGKVNWKKPWTATNLPMNYHSKKTYNGWNLFTTMFSGFSSPYWLTFNQVRALKGHVKAGEKGLPIVYWKPSEYERTKADGTKETKSFLLLKYYTIFNAEQIEGIQFKELPKNFIGTEETLEQSIKMEVPVTVKHTPSNSAYYSPSSDYVNMPLKESFHSTGEYYSTLIHELAHSTGNAKRLNRFEKHKTEFNSHGHEYSFEELVAEISASTAMAMFGINTQQTDDNNAAYLQSWLKEFKSNKEMLFKAITDSKKAVDYIFGLNKKQTEEAETE